MSLYQRYTISNYALNPMEATDREFPVFLHEPLDYFLVHFKDLTPAQLMFYKLIFVFFGCTRRSNFPIPKYLNVVIDSLSADEPVGNKLVHDSVERLLQVYDWRFWRQYLYTVYPDHTPHPFYGAREKELIDIPLYILPVIQEDHVHLAIVEEHPLVEANIRALVSGKATYAKFELKDDKEFLCLGRSGFYQTFCQDRENHVKPSIIEIDQYNDILATIPDILTETDMNLLFNRLIAVAITGQEAFARGELNPTEAQHRLSLKYSQMRRYMGESCGKRCKTKEEYLAWRNQCLSAGFSIFPWHKGFTGPGNYGIGDTCAQFMKFLDPNGEYE